MEWTSEYSQWCQIGDEILHSWIWSKIDLLYNKLTASLNWMWENKLKKLPSNVNQTDSKESWTMHYNWLDASKFEINCCFQSTAVKCVLRDFALEKNVTTNVALFGQAVAFAKY